MAEVKQSCLMQMDMAKKPCPISANGQGCEGPDRSSKSTILHPIAQRLTIDACLPRRMLARRPVQNQGNRQQAAGLRCIVTTLCRRT